MEAARGCFVEALEIRRQLASQNVETYSPGIAMALNGLGQVEFELNDFQAALRRLEEAVKILESDPMSHLGVRLRERQTVWTNLGKVHRTDKGLERPNYGAARDALRRAVNYAEEFRSSFHDRTLRKAIYSKMPDPYELLVEKVRTRCGCRPWRSQTRATVM